ncbi:testis-expressed protein 13C-1-like [Loxodonta africana]|uniref:testis-expressed protein 13C-1-like n=1 Tax=Loxodonta africana TaxID=9785 RepID=UPI0030CD0971
MAVNFRDPRCGFRHREVVEFINEEIRSNGTDLDFYVAYSSESWSLVEDRLRAILCDRRVPRTFKGACAWSALAMSTTVVSRQRVQLLHRVRRLQEKVSQREVATWPWPQSCSTCVRSAKTSFCSCAKAGRPAEVAG